MTAIGMEVQLITFAVSTVKLDTMKFLYNKVWKVIVFFLVDSLRCLFLWILFLSSGAFKENKEVKQIRYKDINKIEIFFDNFMILKF